MNRPFHATKFKTEFLGKKIPADPRIDELKGWCSAFHRFHLAPLHKYGACGNLSFRIAEGERPFVITASGTAFDEPPPDACFVKVLSCDLDQGTVYAEGEREPSSESMFHFAIYRAREDVHAVFHGHSREILARGPLLGLRETNQEEPYGTVALVRRILEVLDHEFFVVVKNHGFISLGGTMKEAGERALEVCRIISSQ